MNKNAPIGIFDSGIGGLTVAKAIKELLPNEQLIYFGDTLHLPYGEKSANSIQRYSMEISSFLKSKKCKAIVIACNSASSVAFSSTRQYVGSNTILLNVIDPLVAYVKATFAGQKVGIIGTKATINSNAYQSKLSSVCEVAALSTPLLAPMIEEGFINDKISSAIIEEYVHHPELNGIKSLLLGCTHYPIIHSEIEKIYGGAVNVLDSNTWIANTLKHKLELLDLVSSEVGRTDQFYVSDLTDSFARSAEYFFGQTINLEEQSLR